MVDKRIREKHLAAQKEVVSIQEMIPVVHAKSNIHELGVTAHTQQRYHIREYLTISIFLTALVIIAAFFHFSFALGFEDVVIRLSATGYIVMDALVVVFCLALLVGGVKCSWSNDNLLWQIVSCVVGSAIGGIVIGAGILLAEGALLVAAFSGVSFG